MTDPTTQRHVLVVDDQEEILDLTCSVLGAAGHLVSRASSGLQALDRLAEQPCDLVLLDINMPGMDGWEVLRLIRADDTLAALPVVMFSVKGEVGDKIQGMQEGAVDYITKPFEVDALLARVRRLLEPPPLKDYRPSEAPSPV